MKAKPTESPGFSITPLPALWLSIAAAVAIYLNLWRRLPGAVVRAIDPLMLGAAQPWFVWCARWIRPETSGGKTIALVAGLCANATLIAAAGSVLWRRMRAPNA
ncbi:MAG TPA: hypothetical protein VFW66_01235 [Gemmatimonadales bacterium]|nr:hypothetical protein [Gemmatimonadales bacterium]